VAFLPARKVHPEQVGKNLLIHLPAARGLGMIGGQRLAGAGVAPDLGPVFGPAAFGVRGGIGGQDGPVQCLMGQAEPRGPLVVKVGEGPLFQAGILGGNGHDHRLADERPGLGRHIGKVLGQIDALGDGVDPFRGIQPPLALGIEFLGRLADTFPDRIFLGFLPRRPSLLESRGR